jgi:hypothetical protein
MRSRCWVGRRLRAVEKVLAEEKRAFFARLSLLDGAQRGRFAAAMAVRRADYAGARDRRPSPGRTRRHGAAGAGILKAARAGPGTGAPSIRWPNGSIAKRAKRRSGSSMHGLEACAAVVLQRSARALADTGRIGEGRAARWAASSRVR